MQIDRLEYIAVTNGLHAQIGIMTRLARERRVTIEALKKELQYRDNILTEVRAKAARADVEHQEEVGMMADYMTRLSSILDGSESTPPTEADLPVFTLAWNTRKAFEKAQKRIAKCRACKGGTCCK